MQCIAWKKKPPLQRLMLSGSGKAADGEIFAFYPRRASMQSCPASCHQHDKNGGNGFSRTMLHRSATSRNCCWPQGNFQHLKIGAKS